MIASWMLYALAISILITLAALAAERVGEARGWPIRAVWTAALILSVGWPVAPLVARLLPSPPPPVSVLPFVIVVQAPATDAPAAANVALIVDRALLVLWIALSTLLVARIVAGVRSVRHAREQWKGRSVDGVRVKISDNVGPAVVGLSQMDVVLPEWILSLDEPLRAIVLRHEEEHRLARDPYLLFSSAIAMALMPWNLPLWFQARRLRLAIEMDCDARVLRIHPTPERYGMLMLTIAQRRSVAPAMFAPMLTEPTTNLERRILAMRSTTKKVARITAFGGGVVAVAMLAFASTLQSANRSFAKPKVSAALTQAANFITSSAQTASAEKSRGSFRDTQSVRRLPAAVSSAPASTQTTSQPSMTQSTQVQERHQQQAQEQQGNPAPRYPETLRSAGVEGSVVARYRTNAAGVPDSGSIEIVSSTHGMFTDAVLRVLPLWHLAANVSVETPFTFALGDGAGLSGPVTAINGKPVSGVVIIASRGAPGEPPRVRELAPVRATAGGVDDQQTPGPRRVSDNQTYFEFQVEQQVTPLPGQKGPRYPDELRAAHVEGQVLAQFIVDTTGTPLMDTFKVLKSDNPLFTDAVRGSLTDMRFSAARVGGKPVKQLIQMPFQFDLSKR